MNVCFEYFMIIYSFSKIELFWKISGNQDLRVSDINLASKTHPSLMDSLPDDYPDLKDQLVKLETQMFNRPSRKSHQPLTPVIADANER